ncbi:MULTISPECIES: RAD55 family ATPase [unclassified Halobacterium]|jgi:KaiC/GvpD/RAD55 family RecA-like ATPase|uniref:RAD55 family ATPase n=1 Tax=unclassified Halobacterium TaxID=2668073 RepID=UPI001E46A738|nr:MULTISPECIES: RAD55 family ATPase [unclassified Halobacterium]MCD2198707.1 RAD55 family ATPase [Halobacterium sp. KA-4]MCD2204753.1 RAD55 family ATPase [Halobacterium sp. KA-6]
MRISTGVAGLDSLLDGGLPARRLYTLSGPPGSGKTTLAAQYVTEGVKNGEEVLYVTMHETRNELVDDMANYDFGFSRAANAENFEFLNLTRERSRRSLTQYGRESGLSSRLASMIRQEDYDRVVVDSTMLLAHFADDADAEVTHFATGLKQTDATVLLVSEMTDPTAYAEEHYLAHGVIFLHNFLEGGGMTRGVQLVKMRGTNIDCDIRDVSFTGGGLQVDPGRKVRPE